MVILILIDDTRFELESVSDDETDDIELEDEREQGFARSLSDSLNHPSKVAESLFQPSMADGGSSARTTNFRETMANVSPLLFDFSEFIYCVFLCSMLIQCVRLSPRLSLVQWMSLDRVLMLLLVRQLI